MNKKIKIFSAVLSLLTAVLFASSVQAHDQNDEFHVAALIVKKRESPICPPLKKQGRRTLMVS